MKTRTYLSRKDKVEEVLPAQNHQSYIYFQENLLVWTMLRKIVYFTMIPTSLG